MSEKKIIIPKPGMEIPRTDVGGEIWDPQDLRPEQSGDAFFCSICGESWPKGHRTSYIKHVDKCATANEGTLREASLRVKMPDLFDPEISGDPDLRRYYKDPLNVEKERKLIEKDSK